MNDSSIRIGRKFELFVVLVDFVDSDGDDRSAFVHETGEICLWASETEAKLWTSDLAKVRAAMTAEGWGVSEVTDARICQVRVFP